MIGERVSPFSKLLWKNLPWNEQIPHENQCSHNPFCVPFGAKEFFSGSGLLASGSTRWASINYKWAYNAYKWPKINAFHRCCFIAVSFKKNSYSIVSIVIKLRWAKTTWCFFRCGTFDWPMGKEWFQKKNWIPSKRYLGRRVACFCWLIRYPGDFQGHATTEKKGYVLFGCW